MYLWIGMVAAGRVVTIWAKKKITRQIFQTVVVAGFTGYYVQGQINKNKNKYKPTVEKQPKFIKI
jgi:hypothetical protein